jgi:serine/threonine-protein kinase
MTPERWAELEPLVDAALRLPPPERRSYVESMNAKDPALAEQLAHLVDLATQSDALFDAAAAERAELLADDADVESDLLDTLQASLGATYTLEREIGGGGMSRVFVAHESGLDRKVAIKVLPASLAAGVNADRFAREIKLAASLQQANIVPLLSAGTAAGLPYYTMPLVEGESLRSHLERVGALPINEATGILRDLARALAYAHAHGVIHRDIKPGNVLLSGRTAVVTDFGIAKALGASRNDAAHITLTGTGTSIGTPAYMAPEQAAGDPNVDHRADIYAFGCVAYEVFTGRPPFVQSSAHELIAAHFREVPKAIGELRPDVSPAIELLVARCLEKDPAQRPQSADDLLDSLETTITGPIAQPRSRSRRARTVALAAAAAVLAGAMAFMYRAQHPPQPLTFAIVPFRNLAHDTTLSYKSDGIGDEILNQIAKVQGIRIVGRDAARRFVDRPGQDAPDVRAVENALGVRLLVTGTLREIDGRVTISTQLNDSADRGELWSGSFVRDSKDFGAIAGDIARAISDTLRGRFGDRIRIPQRARQAKNPPDPAALDLYLVAQQQMRRRGAGVHQSILNFERATRIDPSFARAYAGLATALQLSPFFDRVHPDDVRDRTFNSARRALELDSTLADAHVALGSLYAFSGEWDRSDAEFRRALALEPENAAAQQTFARLLLDRGLVSEAMDHLLAAERTEHASPVISAWLANAYFLSGRVDSALAESARAIQLDSASLPVINIASQINVAVGSRDVARRLVDAASPATMTEAPYVYARLGDTASAYRLLRTIQTEVPVPWYADAERASIFFALGDTANALTALERTSQVSGAAWIQFLFSLIDPIYDPVRKSPRFAALVRSAKLDPQPLIAVRHAQ